MLKTNKQWNLPIKPYQPTKDASGSHIMAGKSDFNNE